MKKLIDLLKDGNSRTIETLAAELGTTPSDINRQLEYLEHIGVIRKISFSNDMKCKSCSGCSGSESACNACKRCIPENVSENMGGMWEIVGSH